MKAATMNRHRRAVRLVLVLALLYAAARLLRALCEFWMLFWLLMIIALEQGR